MIYLKVSNGGKQNAEGNLNFPMRDSNDIIDYSLHKGRRGGARSKPQSSE